jgi:hypothetical protein
VYWAPNPTRSKLQDHSVMQRGVKHEVGAVPSVCHSGTLENCFNHLVDKQKNKKNRKMFF